MRTGGPLYVKLERDEKGQRTYRVPFQVEVDDVDEGTHQGPQQVLSCPGLPLPGSIYNIGSDVDPWAFCTRRVTVDPDPAVRLAPGGPIKFWIAEFEFKSPGAADPDEQANCTGDVENPLMQPPVIRRSWSDWSEEPRLDRFGEPVINTAHERVRGLEIQRSREVITIEQNLLDPQEDLLEELRDTLNQNELWGKPRRSVRFVVRDIQRLFYGMCFKYFKRVLEFQVRTRRIRVGEGNLVVGDWDQHLPDEGYRALSGRWDRAVDPVTGRRWKLIPILGYQGSPNPNPVDPSHFVDLTYPDANQLHEPWPLDGAGKPAEQDALNIVTQCTADCPDGAPTAWRVSGFGQDVSVNHVGGAGSCVWTGFGITLNWDTADLRWELTHPTHSGLWVLRGGERWNCVGPNRMIKDGPPFGSGPSSVTVSPQRGTERGTLHFELMDESDFLTLGIPLSLS